MSNAVAFLVIPLLAATLGIGTSLALGTSASSGRSRIS